MKVRIRKVTTKPQISQILERFNKEFVNESNELNEEELKSNSLNLYILLFLFICGIRAKRESCEAKICEICGYICLYLNISEEKNELKSKERRIGDDHRFGHLGRLMLRDSKLEFRL
ncbi:hypothetical protein KJ693_04865 [bacterium]|nr:hypothetical protein [bacterium]MBU1614628.1 hypothetical protein [bacterium]